MASYPAPPRFLYSSVELNGANFLTVNVTTYPGEISCVKVVPTWRVSPAPRFSTVALLLAISNHLICFVNRSVFLSAYCFQWFTCSSSESGGSVTVSATSARNAFSLLISLPLRSSFLPVFAIELLSETGSVFAAALPTVGLPFVVSSVAGVSFFSTGLFFNFELTVVTNFW